MKLGNVLVAVTRQWAKYLRRTSASSKNGEFHPRAIRLGILIDSLARDRCPIGGGKSFKKIAFTNYPTKIQDMLGLPLKPLSRSTNVPDHTEQ